jgi:uncharacterized protein YjbJ (UPF0337 family)
VNWDQIEGNWKQLQGKFRENWGKLTDSDLEVVVGVSPDDASSGLD